MTKKEIVPIERIENKIFLIREKKVMLDRDLAELYGVETRALKQAVKRNKDRFPIDFMFLLNKTESNELVSQNVIPSSSYLGGAKPMVFTEQGVAMLSSVLNSKRAVHVNIQIMRAFVNLRELLASHKDLAKRLDKLEQRYDKKFMVVFEAIRELIEMPKKDTKKIGF